MKNFSMLIANGCANAMVLGTAATIGMASTPADAASLSFVGSFVNPTNPNELVTNTFVTTSSSLVNFRSYGADGGTNAANITIAPGGFEPILTVFDNPTGNFIFEQYLSASGASDFNVDRTLAAGNYKVVISTFANFLKQSNTLPRNIADGFENKGEFFGQRPNYAFDINNVNLATTTAVPEPADLIGTVIGGLSVVMFKRKLSADKKS